MKVRVFESVAVAVLIAAGTGRVFAGGSAISETVPEPGTACLVFAAAVIAIKLQGKP